MDDAVDTAESELINRRSALQLAAVGGAALLKPLGGWAEPLRDTTLSNRQGAFAADEVEALERVVAAFREWRGEGTGIGRTAVVGQLADVCERLRSAPAGSLTDRVFLGAAELAKRAHLLAGAPDAAAAAVEAAVPLVDARLPGRLGRKLRDWYVESTAFATVPAVAAARTAVRDVASARVADIGRVW